MKIGNYEIRPVIDGAMKIPVQMMFPKLSDDDWLPHKDLLTDDGRIEMATGGFLVTGNGTVALVDVGAGAVEAMPEFGGKFMESLGALGFKPEDVTDVLFSHLHFDHIGWASIDGAAAFPNATYRCHAKDWDYFMTRAIPQPPTTEVMGLPSATEHWMGPVTDRIEMWDGDANILPGVDVRDAPGHTDGSALIVISSGTDRAVLLGDAVHCPAELLESEWEGVADVDPDLAKKTREALAKEFEGTDIPLAAAHFPGLQFGRLLKGEGRAAWVFD
jgi:glyoxylase-like metal-dependent hydrolase (beta-lactamase superfamily II)